MKTQNDPAVFGRDINSINYANFVGKREDILFNVIKKHIKK